MEYMELFIKTLMKYGYSQELAIDCYNAQDHGDRGDPIDDAMDELSYGAD